MISDFAKGCLLACVAVACIRIEQGFARSSRVAHTPQARAMTPPRDGQHDFDFEIGSWKTHFTRLVHPLTGSKTWLTYDGITTVTKVWNGRANLVELVADGPDGHFEGLNLRLYNPEGHQWSLNYSNVRSGTLGQPTVGEFKNGRGEFYDCEPFEGKRIFSRFIWTHDSPDSCHWEQAFSADSGATWETNWTMDFTRIS